MTDLPPGWCWARFADVATIASQLVDPLDYLELAHVAPNHIESRTGRLLEVSTIGEDGVTSKKHLFRPGQILYSKIRPYLAKAAVVGFEGLCSADMYPIDSSMEVRYLHRWMTSPAFTRYAVEKQGRSVLPKINQAELSVLPVPVPPLSEQSRIIDAIEQQLSLLDHAEALLKQARSHLGLFRQRVIDVGLSGERVALGQALAHAAVFSDGDWVETKDQDPDGDTRLIQLADIGVGAFRDRSRRFLTAEAATRLRCTHLAPGDVLIARMPDPLGRACVFPGVDGPAVTAVDVCIVRPDPEELDPRFLVIAMNSSRARQQIMSLQSGTTRKRISRKNLATVAIPLPPLHEQRQVIDHVEAQHSRVDAMVATIDSAVERSTTLRRAILDRAFRGALVPQDPNDEPASVLLERIAAGRPAGAAKRRGRASPKAS